MSSAQPGVPQDDGANLYRMFREGTLISTDTTHKAYLDSLYNNLMMNPDMEVFTRLYASYLSTNHPYTGYTTLQGPA